MCPQECVSHSVRGGGVGGAIPPLWDQNPCHQIRSEIIPLERTWDQTECDIIPARTTKTGGIYSTGMLSCYKMSLPKILCSLNLYDN